MGALVRTITADGSVVGFGVDSTDIVNRACDIHKPSATVAAALGRLLSATSMMGEMLKNADNSVTVTIRGGGPAGTLMAVADGRGNVRGYVSNPRADLPLSSRGKLDVGGVVGKNGTIQVLKDLNLKEPYSGQTELVSGEIAEDITSYFALSEQIPTICALGVLVDRDLSVRVSGGYIIQLLPYADPSAIDRLESNLKAMPSVTSLLSGGATPEQMIRRILNGFEVEVLDRRQVGYVCNCSRLRVARALAGVGRKELQSLADEEGGAEVVCRFCKKAYIFKKQELVAMAQQETKK